MKDEFGGDGLVSYGDYRNANKEKSDEKEIEEIWKWFEQVSDEAMSRGLPLNKEQWMIKALLSLLSEKEGKIERLRQALGDIVDPIGKFKRELKPGEQLDGMWCVRLSDNPHYLKGMAKDALEEPK